MEITFLLVSWANEKYIKFFKYFGLLRGEFTHFSVNNKKNIYFYRTVGVYGRNRMSRRVMMVHWNYGIGLLEQLLFTFL